MPYIQIWNAFFAFMRCSVSLSLRGDFLYNLSPILPYFHRLSLFMIVLFSPLWNEVVLFIRLILLRDLHFFFWCFKVSTVIVRNIDSKPHRYNLFLAQHCKTLYWESPLAFNFIFDWKLLFASFMVSFVSFIKSLHQWNIWASILLIPPTRRHTFPICFTPAKNKSE